MIILCLIIKYTVKVHHREHGNKLSATHYVKLSEMEIFVATVVVTFFIFENLIGACKVAPNGERRKLANEQAGEREPVERAKSLSRLSNI
jgi:hypothetical protein